MRYLIVILAAKLDGVYSTSCEWYLRQVRIVLDNHRETRVREWHWNAFERVHLGYRRKPMKYNSDAESPATPVRQFYYSIFFVLYISQRVLPLYCNFAK